MTSDRDHCFLAHLCIQRGLDTGVYPALESSGLCHSSQLTTLRSTHILVHESLAVNLNIKVSADGESTITVDSPSALTFTH